MAYDLTFLTTTGWSRPVLGTLTALAIIGWFLWAVALARRTEVSVPMWGLLAALATSVTGGILGVLYGILIASRGDAKVLPAGGEDAHPATMVVGFLVPVGLALIEWWLRPDEARTPACRAGFWQMALLFLGGFTLMIGVLLDAVPLITLNLPFEIVAIGIFLRRNWASLRTVGWDEGRPPPFLAAATVATIWNLGMLIYLLSKYADDFDAAPDRLLLALDHVMFIGVLTNVLFAQLLAATRRRATSGRGPTRWCSGSSTSASPASGSGWSSTRPGPSGPSPRSWASASCSASASSWPVCRPTANRPPSPPAPDR